MKQFSVFIAILAIAVACSQQGDSDVSEKKKELAEARKEYQALKDKITKLEGELKEKDPEFAKESDKAVLVSTFVPEKGAFEHRVDVRGSVASRKNVLISAQTPGLIERVEVREGQRVSKGQVLVAQDADIIKSSIHELKTQLELATTVYERQSKLWEQKIGTEVQYLQAKNNKESLESRLNAAYAQLNQAIVKAPFSGTVDEVSVREGEMASPGLPLVRLTSPEDMYIIAEVSEKFLGKVLPGDKVEVYFPLQDKKLSSAVASVSEIINPENRTFRVEVRLPKSDAQLKPNQVTILQIIDYVKKDAISIPTRLILRDDEGEYVYGVETKDKNNVVKKIRVTSGMTYDGKTEVKAGLAGTEQLIDKGFRDVSEGIQVAIAKPEEVSKVAKN